MRLLEIVCQRLDDKHPHLRYSVQGCTITVRAPESNGHEVWLTENTDDWIVGYDGWHEHFVSEKEALDCFAFGLSGQCRLRVCLRGNFAYRWTLETLNDNDWTTESTTDLLLCPFWRPRRIEYRQNPALKMSS